MDQKEFDKFIEKDDAFDTKKLLEGVDLSRVMEELDLEEILAEYGSHEAPPAPAEDGVWVNEGYVPKPVRPRKERSPRAAVRKEAPLAPEPPAETRPRQEETKEDPRPAEDAPARKASPSEPETWDPEPQALYEPPVPRQEPRGGVPLKDVMAQVVDAVMEEEEARRQVAQPAVRRGLFSRKRRRFEDTEPLYTPPEEEPEEPSYVEDARGEEEEAEEELPERDSGEATGDYHRRYKRLRRRSRPALLLALLACALAGVEYSGAAAGYLEPDAGMALHLGLLLIQCLLCLPVFARAVTELLHRRCQPELLVSLFALAAAADGASFWLDGGRGAQLPLCTVAAAALYLTMRGEMLRLRGLRDSCHMATYDQEPYIVTAVAGGFRKQSSSAEGFIRMTEQESEQRAWYYLLLPVILTACTVFAVLTAVNRFDLDNFFWYWSAILGAASSFAFTAAFGTPLGKLARRLQRDGCAVASYSGAAMMSRKGSMVLTDSDLFPPGTVFMNGMKVYAHDAIQAVSYASSLMTASGCGLRQVFDDLCRSQGGHTYPVEDFSFYQEGGIAGTIRGESVLVGRADFMAQMGVRLPREIKLKTGVFLAVDKELVAVFAVKYMASDNVDAALQAILHNGIRPVFAVRDFNITPALIKRKFRINTKKRCLYPELSDRLALSEEEYESSGRPGALLFRNGLMPYAEVVIGGKRMHGAVRKNCAWALIGSICGTLLAFYLTFVSGYNVLNPAALLTFQLLWSVPAAMINGWVSQY